MANTVTPSASVWAVATRITPLDQYGNLIAGSGSFVTSTLIKATMTPVYEAGDAIAIKNAAGELAVYAKHGDIPKWFTASIDLALPDPYLEQVLTGGTVYSDSTAALGAATVPTAQTFTTGGTILAGTSYYSTAAYTAYGRALPSPLVSIVSTGSTSKNVVQPVFFGTEQGQIVYGRAIGSGYQQALGSVPNIGSQATSAASGTGVVTSLSVTALTKPIPLGTTFMITGDTNSPKIIFTTTAAATPGQTSLAVSASASISITIAAATLLPVFVDTGAITPSGLPNSIDYSGGPGLDVGYQTAAQGATSNPNGVAIEMWQKRIVNGVQATDYPYWWHVWPGVKNLHVMPRDFTNANLQSAFEGDAFQNANFGSGPMGNWPFDSTKAFQRAVCGLDVVPIPSVLPVTAEY